MGFKKQSIKRKNNFMKKNKKLIKFLAKHQNNR